MPTSANIPAMFGRVWTAPPEEALWDMYENDASFDEASQNVLDRSMADDIDLSGEDFFNVIEDQDPDALEKAIYQINVAMDNDLDPSGINTPYGPGLEIDEISALVEQYPAIEAGLELAAMEDYFVDADEIVKNAPELDAILDAVEQRTEAEGRIGEESMFWGPIGDQLGDALSIEDEGIRPPGALAITPPQVDISGALDMFKGVASNIADFFTEGFEAQAAGQKELAGGAQDIGGDITDWGQDIAGDIAGFGEEAITGYGESIEQRLAKPGDLELSTLFNPNPDGSYPSLAEILEDLRGEDELDRTTPEEIASWMSSSGFDAKALQAGHDPAELRAALEEYALSIGEPVIADEFEDLFPGPYTVLDEDVPRVQPGGGVTPWEPTSPAGEPPGMPPYIAPPGPLGSTAPPRMPPYISPPGPWGGTAPPTEGSLYEASQVSAAEAEKWDAEHAANLRKIFYTKAYAYPGAGRAAEQENLKTLHADTKTLFFLFGGSAIWGGAAGTFNEAIDKLYGSQPLAKTNPDYKRQQSRIENSYNEFLTRYFNNPSQFRRGSQFRNRVNLFSRLINMELKDLDRPGNEGLMADYLVAKGLFGGTDDASRRKSLIHLSVTNGSRDYYSQQIHGAADAVMTYYKNIGKSDEEIFSIMTGNPGAKAATDVIQKNVPVPEAAARAAAGGPTQEEAETVIPPPGPPEYPEFDLGDQPAFDWSAGWDPDQTPYDPIMMDPVAMGPMYPETDFDPFEGSPVEPWAAGWDPDLVGRRR